MEFEGYDGAKGGQIRKIGTVSRVQPSASAEFLPLVPPMCPHARTAEGRCGKQTRLDDLGSEFTAGQLERGSCQARPSALAEDDQDRTRVSFRSLYTVCVWVPYIETRAAVSRRASLQNRQADVAHRLVGSTPAPPR